MAEKVNQPLSPRHGPANVAQVAFLAALIDYAGLFPPASLSLEAAWANYRRYRQSDAWWLLGRFLLPATQISAWGDVAAANFVRTRRPYRLTIIGRGAATAASLVQTVADDIQAIEQLRSRGGPAVAVEAYEGRLPAPTIPPGAVAEICYLLLEAGVTPFFELPPGENWIGAMRRFVAHLPVGAGFKLRCGGTAATPPATAVAATIDATRDAGVPLKATAGLHHAFSRNKPREFGFVNLVAAAILADAHGLVESTVATILADTDGTNFQLDGDSLRWRNWHVAATHIRARRRKHLIGFGSCDFEEPGAELAVLGWLGAAVDESTHQEHQ